MKQLFCDCCGRQLSSYYDSVTCGPYEMCYPCSRIWHSVIGRTYELALNETRRRVELWKTVDHVEVRRDLSPQ